MTKTSYGMTHKIATLIAAGGGVGYLPFMPGTWGTFVAFGIAFGVLFYGGGLLTLMILTLSLTGLGYGVCHYLTPPERDSLYDPQWIVIDEIAGYLWGVVFLQGLMPLTPLLLITLFCLFRLFDIQKPWPISWIDQTLGQKWPSLAIMLDDGVASVLAAVVVWLVFRIY